MGNLASMINVANKQHALFTVFEGDMRYKTDYLYAFKKIYLPPSNYTHFNMPILFSIGNHEEDKKDGILDDAEATYHYIFGNESYYSWTEKNAYFIELDNENGNLPINEYNWLKDQLNKSTKYENTFIFMHIPLWTQQIKHTTACALMIQKLPSEQLLFRNYLTATLTLQCYSLLTYTTITLESGALLPS